jgi:hypothetical protein
LTEAWSEIEVQQLFLGRLILDLREVVYLLLVQVAAPMEVWLVH